MSELHEYSLFISHAWHRSEHYTRIVTWLHEAPRFRWRNLSVPEHRPVDNNAVEYELRNQMRDAEAFLILGGMYAAHSAWIEFELNFAWRIGRPIIGIRPWGADRMPLIIQNAATVVCNWNRDSIVAAIREHALRRS